MKVFLFRSEKTASDDGSAFNMRLSRNSAYTDAVKPDGRTYREAFTGEPIVFVRGPLASVWGEYEFWIDGTFSHCGVDSVQLAKRDGAWKIVSFAWTVERQDCPTAPTVD